MRKSDSGGEDGPSLYFQIIVIPTKAWEEPAVAYGESTACKPAALSARLQQVPRLHCPVRNERSISARDDRGQVSSSFLSIKIHKQIMVLIHSHAMQLGCGQLGREALPDGDCQVFRGGDARGKFRNFFVQKAVVHGV